MRWYDGSVTAQGPFDQLPIHSDQLDFLLELGRAGVHYLMIGGFAVGVHATPRMTKDLDVWVTLEGDNRQRLAASLIAFGAPSALIAEVQVATSDEFIRFGREPVGIDILFSVVGLTDFREAKEQAEKVSIGGVEVWVIGVDHLLVAKRAAGRPQDLADVEKIEKVQKIGTQMTGDDDHSIP